MSLFWNNPVHAKEFRERFRSRKTVWIICSYLLVVGAILLGFIYVDSLNRHYFIPGEARAFFIAFSIIQIVLIGFMAPGLSAGAISGERERQTLNILLTTHLTPLSIIVSKLISSISFIALLIFMSLPLYSFVFLFGGISPDQVFIVFLYYLVNIFFFGSMGLFCSTWIKRTGVSTVTAYGFAFFIGAGTALIFAFLYDLLPAFGWKPYEMFSMYFLYSLNPIFSLLDIFDEALGSRFIFRTSVTPWLIYMVFYTLLGLVLVLASGYLLKPVKGYSRK